MAKKTIKPGKRLCLTAAKDRLVEPTDPNAASLYCSEHAEVDADEFKKLGGHKMLHRAPSNKKLKASSENKSADDDNLGVNE